MSLAAGRYTLPDTIGNADNLRARGARMIDAPEHHTTRPPMMPSPAAAGPNEQADPGQDGPQPGSGRRAARALLLLAVGALSAASVMVRVDNSVALHILQHIALMTAVPPLVLRCVPRLAAGPAFGAARGGLLILVGVLLVYAVHVPALFNADLRQAVVGIGTHLVLLVAGALMALPFAGQRTVTGMAAVLLVGVAELGIGVLGMWLTWIPDLVYVLPSGHTPRFGLDPASDQALGGALLLVLAEPVLAIELVVLFFRALSDRPDEEEPRPLGAPG